MTMPAATTRTIAARQLAIASALGVVVLLCFSGLDIAARNETLVERIERAREERCRDAKWYYRREQYYYDRGDQMLLDELPFADYSRGGCYLIGQSNVSMSTRFWTLPPEARCLIHNYAVDQSNHEMHHQLVRFLVEKERLLSAGAEKNLVLLGVSYHASAELNDSANYFVRIWGRHGLFTYSQANGIEVAPMPDIARFVRREHARVAGFLRCMIDPMGWNRRNEVPGAVRRVDRDGYNRGMSARFGPKWEQRVSIQLAEFGRLLDYLSTMRVPVIVVLWPLGTWEDNLPFERHYNDQMRNLCRQKGVGLLDWSRMLDDDDFADYCHPNVDGSEKINRAVVDLGLSHLRATGALRD